MATVDFTLDDIRTVVREEAGQVFEEKFGPAFDNAFGKAFGPAFDKAFSKAFGPAFDNAFGEKFGPAFEAAFDPYALAIQQDLTQLKTDLTEVKADVKGLNRVVSQHSRDIMDLRSRLA